MDVNCEGCALEQLEFLKCSIIHHGDQPKCPCKSCIVKGICGDACVEWLDLMKENEKWG